MPTIDRNDGARHPGRGVGGEEEERAVEILGLTEAAHRDALDHRLPGLAREEFLVELGRDVAGRERVNADAVARPFKGERLR